MVNRDESSGELALHFVPDPAAFSASAMCGPCGPSASTAETSGLSGTHDQVGVELA